MYISILNVPLLVFKDTNISGINFHVKIISKVCWSLQNVINFVCGQYIKMLFYEIMQNMASSSVIDQRVVNYTPVHYLLAVTQYAYLPNAVLNRACQGKLSTPARAHTKTRSVCTCLKATSACFRDCQKVVNRSIAVIIIKTGYTMLYLYVCKPRYNFSQTRAVWALLHTKKLLAVQCTV